MTHLDPKALEAATERHDNWTGRANTIGSLNAARNTRQIISAYLAALPQAEPVAWRARRHGSSEWVLFTYDPRVHTQYAFFEPLFASPTPAVSRDDVIEECIAALEKHSASYLPGGPSDMKGGAAAAINVLRALSQPHSEK